MTQQAIADELGVSKQNVSNWCQNREQDSSFTNAPESRQHFDVWNFHTDADKDTTYFGKMPEQVVDNLLWLSTGALVAHKLPKNWRKNWRKTPEAAPVTSTDTAPDLQKQPVGLTGFEPATP